MNLTQAGVEAGIPVITEAHFTVPRYAGAWWQARVRVQGAFLDDLTSYKAVDQYLLRNDEPSAYLGSLLAACQMLADTYYVGPFRNALNLESTNASLGYFDIAVGKPFIQLWKEGGRCITREIG